MTIKGSFPVRWAAKDGAPGTGVTIASSFTKYAASNSGTTHPAESSSNWKTTVPTVANGSYLWTWVHVQYSDGTETNSFSVSRMGIDGRGIRSSVTTYCQKPTTSTPPENFPEDNWGPFPNNLVNDYWLYTRTIVTYSDGDTATSYSVSQIGQGSYYAGCDEYYALSNSNSEPPEGYPAGNYVNGVQIYTDEEEIAVDDPWSTERPTASTSTPYIWNFEVSYDSRGNKYVTRPICIGNFAKGLVSIVETYTISSHDDKADMLADTAERSTYQWSDESHAVVPTDAKPYKWNKTVTTYNDGTTDTIYHICAIKGADGIGSTYIDLDNENDILMYDASGNLIGGNNGWATSNISLYSNGVKVASPPTFSIEERSASISSSNAVISGSTLTIKGLSSSIGWVIVACTYNGMKYTAKMTVKKLVGQDKYELQLNHTALTYNKTHGVLSNTSIIVEIYRTAQNGSRSKVIGGSMASYQLNAMLYPNGSSVGARSISFPQSTGSGIVNITATDAASWTNFAIVLFKSGAEIDRETVPINKVSDGDKGDKGDKGDSAIFLDLDNENDSILYDGEGNALSDPVVSTGMLYRAGARILSGVTWSIESATGCTLMNSGTATETEYDRAQYPTAVWINASGTVSVNGLTALEGKVVVKASYGGNVYKDVFTLKRLAGQDKYEIICSPNGLTYNTTKGTDQQQTVNIKVYRTTQNGRALVSQLSTYNLTLKCYARQNASDSWSDAGVVTSGYSSGYNKTILANTYAAYKFEVTDRSGVVLDSETVPISKTADGASPIVVDVSPPSLTFPLDADGRNLQSETYNIEFTARKGDDEATCVITAVEAQLHADGIAYTIDDNILAVMSITHVAFSGEVYKVSGNVKQGNTVIGTFTKRVQIVGQNAGQTVTGPAGKGIASLTPYYARNNSSSTAPTSGWGTTRLLPTQSQQYVWCRFLVTYDDGTSGGYTSAYVCISFTNGIGDYTTKYGVNNSLDTPPSTWVSYQLAIILFGASFKYLWEQVTVTYTDGRDPYVTTRVILTYVKDGESPVTIELSNPNVLFTKYGEDVITYLTVYKGTTNITGSVEVTDWEDSEYIDHEIDIDSQNNRYILTSSLIDGKYFDGEIVGTVAVAYNSKVYYKDIHFQCNMRKSAWSIMDWETVSKETSHTFYSDDNVTSDLFISDIVIYDHNQYRCKSGFTAGSDSGMIPWNSCVPGTDNQHWEIFNYTKNIATGLLLTDQALIKNLLVNHILVTGNDGSIYGGFLNGPVSGSFGAVNPGNYRLWLGNADPALAPFSVDWNGRVFANNFARNYDEFIIEGLASDHSASGYSCGAKDDCASVVVLNAYPEYLRNGKMTVKDFFLIPNPSDVLGKELEIYAPNYINQGGQNCNLPIAIMVYEGHSSDYEYDTEAKEYLERDFINAIYPDATNGAFLTMSGRGANWIILNNYDYTDKTSTPNLKTCKVRLLAIKKSVWAGSDYAEQYRWLILDSENAFISASEQCPQS